MLDKTTTIEAFLDGAAAKQPTPGGGSVAALAGALAAAMGEMVLNYSVGKKGLEKYESLLKPALERLNRQRESLLDSMLLDQRAYELLTNAKKLPKDDPQREWKISAATKVCISIPETIMGAAEMILAMAEEIVDFVNPYLLSDLAVCAELAMATSRAAFYSVRINLPGIADAELRRQREKDCEKNLSRSVTRIQRLIPRIWERVSRS